MPEIRHKPLFENLGFEIRWNQEQVSFLYLFTYSVHSPVRSELHRAVCEIQPQKLSFMWPEKLVISGFLWQSVHCLTFFLVLLKKLVSQADSVSPEAVVEEPPSLGPTCAVKSLFLVTFSKQRFFYPRYLVFHKNCFSHIAFSLTIFPKNTPLRGEAGSHLS